MNYYKYGEVDENKEAYIQVNTLLEYCDPLLKIKQKSDVEDEAYDKNYTYEENQKIEIDNSNSKKPFFLARKTLYDNNSEIENHYDSVYEFGQDGKALNYDKEDEANLITNIDNEGNIPAVTPRESSSSKIKVVAQKIISLLGEEDDDNLDYISYAQISQVTTAINAYSDPTAAPLVEVRGEDYWNPNNKEPNSEIPDDSSSIGLTPPTGLNKNMQNYMYIIIALSIIGSIIKLYKKENQ